MANIKSAKKRVLTSQIRADRNKAVKSRVKTYVKKVDAAVAAGDKAAAEAAYQLLSAKFLRLLLRVSTTRTQLQERFPALQKL